MLDVRAVAEGSDCSFSCARVYPPRIAFGFERIAVSAASMSGAAGRYASAIFELGRDANALESLESELGALKSLIADSDDLSRVVHSPAYGRDDQASAMKAILDKMGAADLTRNFVGLMASKGRLGALPAAIEGFSEMVAEHRGETVAEVISAKELTDAQREKLASNLKSSFGKDVKIDASVDPSLLGGLVVKVGSRMIDSSLKTKLAGLHLTMKAS